MKLIMTLLVRDEADIVRANLDFHLAAGVDAVVAIDNGSRDGTREILAEYQAAGVAEVLDEPGRDFAQGAWVTRAALHARDRMGADWIFNNDADEFWVAPGGSLKEVAEGQMLHCARRNMFTAAETLGRGDWADRLIHRTGTPVPTPELKDIYRDPLPCPYLYLDLPGKVMLRAAGLQRVAQGNHHGWYDDPVTPREAPVVIYHFPIRTPEQFEKKIRQGGQAYAANRDLPERMGWHWRRWYRMYQESGLDAVLADTLPSQDRLAADLASGRVVRDTGFPGQPETPGPIRAAALSARP